MISVKRGITLKYVSNSSGNTNLTWHQVAILNFVKTDVPLRAHFGIVTGNKDRGSEHILIFVASNYFFKYFETCTLCGSVI